MGLCLKQVSLSFKIFNFFFKPKKELDISNFNKVKDFILKNSVDVVINCASYTDVCNAEENKELADLINNKSVSNLASICSENNLQFVHISTDYVFDGLKCIPYTEIDKTNPINYYGLSKLRGEKQILKYNLKKSIIVRTSWLYSRFGENFPNKILSKINQNRIFSVTENEIGSPTNALDLANVLLDIIPKLNNLNTEIYHFSNSGTCSRYDFANRINTIIDGNYNLIKKDNDRTNKIRPKYSALNSDKIKNKFDLDLRYWITSLEEHLSLINSDHKKKSVNNI